MDASSLKAAPWGCLLRIAVSITCDLVERQRVTMPLYLKSMKSPRVHPPPSFNAILLKLRLGAVMCQDPRSPPTLCGIRASDFEGVWESIVRNDLVTLAETVREGDSRGEISTDDGERRDLWVFFVP